MHQCKVTRERVTELLLSGTNVDLNVALKSDLDQCAECREEFDSLKQTVRVANRLMETVTPTEAYWTGYHARLKRKLMDTQQPQRVAASGERSWLVRVLTMSVRVPVSVAALVLLALGLTIALAVRQSTRGSESPAPNVVQVPVEVPVIQERTVTRVVYRDRAVRHKLKPTSVTSPNDGALAGSRKPVNNANQITLTGFRPLEEIKLTVIKGGSSNEK